MHAAFWVYSLCMGDKLIWLEIPYYVGCYFFFPAFPAFLFFAAILNHISNFSNNLINISLKTPIKASFLDTNANISILGRRFQKLLNK
jgi:hypothetical protein